MTKQTETDSTAEIDTVEGYSTFQIRHADNIRIFYNKSGSISIVCDESESIICIDLSDINYVCNALVTIKTDVEADL